MAYLFLPRIFLFLSLLFVTTYCSGVSLDVEVRSAAEPYSISVVSLDAHFYGVRSAERSAVSHFQVPKSNYVVVEVRFASGYVLSRTVPVSNPGASSRIKVVLSRNDAHHALDLSLERHTVSAKRLPHEVSLARAVGAFESRMESGDYGQAEAILWDLIESQPESALAWNNLGALRLATGDKEMAVEYFQRAIQLRDCTFESNLNLSRVKFELGHYPSALEYAREAGRIRRGHPAALAQESGVLLAMERYIDAKPLLEELLQVDPHNTSFPDLGLAVVLDHLGERIVAAEHVAAWARKHPNHPDAERLLSQAQRAVSEEVKTAENAVYKLGRRRPGAHLLTPSQRD